ncbi:MULTISPECIES: hypothetical protein [Streptomyces]|uniref:hypothetical protein n=1 Tax=Streptomyces TaxID=1883 RepID=UPI000AB4BA40|nr:hypothetical protein [Streptomyces virginiae]
MDALYAIEVEPEVRTRAHEADQVSRAVAARIVCRTEHGPAHMTYSRGKEGNA